jgi:hypothetical protein
VPMVSGTAQERPTCAPCGAPARASAGSHLRP